MATEIYLVKVGMNMTEGVVDEWYIADGDRVEVGDLLYRLETEKVNLDVDAEVAGTVKHLIAEGITMEPGDVVGYIFAEGEEIPDDLGSLGGGATPVAATPAQPVSSPQAAAVPTDSGDRLKSSPAARRLAGELGVDITLVNGSGPGGRVVEADVQAAARSSGSAPSSPIARKLARELGVDLNTVNGSGPGGRITKEDVEAAASAQTAPAAAAVVSSGATSVPVKGMRKTIASRMHDSLMEMAQLTMDMDVDMDDAIKLRNQLVEEWADDGIRPSFTDLVIRAAARALEKHPLMNASWAGSEIVLHGDIHVGMAVSLDEGLIVPVIKDANTISVRSLAEESSRLAAAARDNRLALEELQDGTFTVSALGMMGVDSFTPIINAPQAGILGVNRIREDVAWEADRPVRVQRMRLSLTWDHRVLDGAPAASFLGEIKALLEAPYRLLL